LDADHPGRGVLIARRSTTRWRSPTMMSCAWCLRRMCSLSSSARKTA